MKIVFFTDFYAPSLNGVTAAIDLFATALRKRGHRVYIVAPASDEPVDDGPDVIRLPSIPSVWHKGLRDGILTPKYGRLIRNLKADVYHFHTNGQTGLAGMRLMHENKIPAVFSYHTDYEEYAKVYPRMWAGILAGSLIGPLVVNQPKAWPQTLQGVKPKRTFEEWNQTMVQNLIRASVDYFNEVIVPSAKMRDKLLSYGTTKPITVLPTGMNPTEFPLRQPRPDDSKNNPTILYVGRVAKEKNVDVLLKAFAIAHKKNHRLRLCVVGPGPYLPRMRTQVRELGIASAVVTTGGLPREEALERYAYADIFAFPSMTDTQALVLNEAAYMHLPLVYSDADLSLVAEDNVSGVLVAPEPEAFAKALLELADDPDRCRKLGDAGHQKARGFTIDKQAKKLEEIYKRVI